MSLEEKTIKKDIVYKGRILNVEVHDVELPDGTMSKREILKHNGAVAILALTSKKEVLLVEQYRKAAERVTLEIPAGKLDLGENPLDCAVRELKEETGYQVSKEHFSKIYDTHVAVGYSSELISIYFVDNIDSNILGNLKLDEDEFLNVKRYSLDEVYDMLDKNILTDSKTIIALEWLRRRS
ncbi:NUDIX hydrolase [Gemella sp. GH3]|uniref:NUDIX domain-containing protein n=1 Tax=unclassified Gemella TaxID=2624949 RepID=UPI0015CF92A1|nr:MULTISPECIES: NUDIX hydrolase [unclassified Gemella]MBF0714547.1 NUDIX hydrolase [Gemella sp. GH3.1]NYS51499.1 NUDIX hydrolase [Gemella sp. GH3]